MPLPRIEPCKEFDNLVTMIKMLNITQSTAMPSAEDGKSLRLWCKVLLATPLHSILEADGYELVKTLIDKLWQDSRSSLMRRQANWTLRKKLAA